MYRKYIKRILDIILSIILILLLWPVMLIVSLITLIDLGLPIHNEIREREGKGRKVFIMYKIRTKKLNSSNLPYRQRYTKISWFIDGSRLNELPQLFNVLKGDMSLVGPRPFIPNDVLPNAKPNSKRYLLKPGITGLAQVNGGRSLTHNQKLKYDDIYYDTLSFKTDLKICLLTIFKVCRYEKKRTK